jgi:hypothetical protein
MKRILLTTFAIASVNSSVFAQVTTNERTQYSRTDLLSEESKPLNKSKVQFDFEFANSNKMILGFSELLQVDSLPNLDSLFNVVWYDLQNFRDSINSPLSNFRIDYITSLRGKFIKIWQYPQAVNAYQLKNGEITQLKVKQDNLRIILFTTHPSKIRVLSEPTYKSFSITLLLNNIADLKNLISNGSMQKAIDLLKKDLEENKEGLRKNIIEQYTAHYDVENNMTRKSVKYSTAGLKEKKFNFPIVQMGLQFINGHFSNSIGAGFELVKYKTETESLKFRFLWEPYFFFQNDSVKNFQLIRNDFITFRYHYSSKYGNRIEFNESASFGYLIRKKGNYFQPTTFKFSLPGLKSKSILLEPEFVFNKFFKNFSPSLRLVYFFGED